MQCFSSQMWDTGFAIQAILSANLSKEYGPTLRKAHTFVKASQVQNLIYLCLIYQQFFTFAAGLIVYFTLRFAITQLEIFVKCIATHLKVLGHSRLKIMVGKSQTAQQKGSK